LVYQGGQPVSALPVTLKFDPKLLQVVSVAEGGLLKEGRASTSFSYKIDPSGQLSISNRRSGSEVGRDVSTPGVVAILQVRALPSVSEKITSVQVLSVSPGSSSQRSVFIASPAAHAVTIATSSK
jgi:hypothetical protein